MLAEYTIIWTPIRKPVHQLVSQNNSGVLPLRLGCKMFSDPKFISLFQNST